MALSTGSRVLLDAPLTQEAGAPGSIKVWPLARKSDGSLRVIIINKHAFDTGNVTVKFNRRSLGGGNLLRLDAPNGLWATGGARIAGVSYGYEGVQVRARCARGEAVCRMEARGL